MLRMNDALLVVVDFQERLLPAIEGREALVPRALRLIEFCRILNIPILLTEQYPKGLGRTVPEVLAALPNPTAIEKTAFGCFGDDGFVEAVANTGRRQVLVVGIETHVCVLQTALGALERGYEAFVARDALGSRSQTEHLAGLERMARCGVDVVTVEMAIFEMLGKAGSPQFKQVLPLLK